MSSTVRIALVGEGVTDFEVLRAAITSMLGGRSFDLKLLQPEESLAFTGYGDAGSLGGGWKGVHKWCLQAALRGGGGLSGDPLFISYDLLIVHLDADVAQEDPGSDPIDRRGSAITGLPCWRPCPPASATTEALREAILAWIGETGMPPRTIFCIPSKSTEAWVMAALFPRDKEVVKQNWECYSNPARRLAQQPKHQRISKTQAAYETRAGELADGWSDVVGKLDEAARFHRDFMAQVEVPSAASRST